MSISSEINSSLKSSYDDNIIVHDDATDNECSEIDSEGEEERIDLSNSYNESLHQRLAKNLNNLGYPKSRAKELAASMFSNANQNASTLLLRKQNSLFKSLFLNESTVFIHDKTYIAEGHTKITFQSYLVDLRTAEIIDIVHQKAKSADFVPIIQREVKTQNKFDHPHIVKIFNFHAYNDGKKAAIYSEKCDYSLENVIKTISASFFQKIKLASQIISALQYIHLQGYVHNDIKPDNILIKDGEAKLCDFGLCTPIGSNFKGFKKIYAPEQKKSNPMISTEKTDVYQFGLTLWHLFHPNPPQGHLDTDFVYPEREKLFNNWKASSQAEKLIQQMIFSCLDPDPAKRASAETIMRIFSVIMKSFSSH